MSQQKPIIGMVWYRNQKDYGILKSLFTDGHTLPSTYEQWLSKAERGFKEFQTKGYIVEKAYLDPETFPAWCRERGLDINAQARKEFGNWFVYRKYGGGN